VDERHDGVPPEKNVRCAMTADVGTYSISSGGSVTDTGRALNTA